jgi:hypothetical protein
MPANLQALAQQVESRLAVDEIHAPVGALTTRVGGETLAFPYRVYYAPSRVSEVTAEYRDDALAMCLCLASRHWDGHIREAAIRSLDFSGRPWTIPFAVQLLGEYVVEIGRMLEQRIAELGPHPLLAFAGENPGFIETTRRRVVSYWNCYYRSVYPTLEAYPCHRAMQVFRLVPE